MIISTLIWLLLTLVLAISAIIETSIWLVIIATIVATGIVIVIAFLLDILLFPGKVIKHVYNKMKESKEEKELLDELRKN